MLYLEARCLAAIRAAGSQGVQNGSISCVALVLVGARAACARSWPRTCSPPGSTSRSRRATTRSRRTREIRKTAKLMGQFLPGHRLRHLGLLGDAARGQHVRRRQLRRRRPRGVDDDAARLAGRRRDRAGRGGRGARRPREGGARDAGGVRRARLPAGHGRRRWRRPTYGYASRDLPDRDRAADVAAADRVLEGTVSALDVVRELDAAGFTRRRRGRARDAAPARVGRLPPDLGDDRRPTARVHSAVSDPNPYEGPGTGYRLEGERWELLQQLPYVLDPARSGLVQRRPVASSGQRMLPR